MVDFLLWIVAQNLLFMIGLNAHGSQFWDRDQKNSQMSTISSQFWLRSFVKEPGKEIHKETSSGGEWKLDLPFAFWLNFIVTCHFIALESYVIENHFERTSLSFSFYVNPSSIEQVHDFPGALILYKYVVFETVDV